LEVVFREIVKKDLIEVWELLEQLKPINFTSDIDDAWTEYNGIGIVGLDGDKIIAFGSLVVENKIRGYLSGQIEDVVVDSSYRGKGVGEKLIEEINKKAKKIGCYRVSLFCKEELIPFYNKNGYEVNNIVMKKWF
jgi:glucosamine-phosphate N-acetyltransferase